MFFTKLDSRAAVKGSRDPLGVQPIWTRLGRHIVGNLTTVSGTVTDFTTVMLGYHFAEALSEGSEGTSELDTFLKWEQLAGYSRGCVNNDWVFRGTERAAERYRVHHRATIGADRDSQIMSDQKSYGLWGLYTAPSVPSGLLSGSPSRLTPSARDHASTQYLPILEKGAGKGAKKLMQLLARDSWTVDFKRPDTELLTSIARVHNRKLTGVERAFYDEHLVQGGPSDRTNGFQVIFADVLTPYAHADDFSWSTQIVRKLAGAAERLGERGQALGESLKRIATCESVLAPASATFGYLLAMDGAPVGEAAKRLKKQWGKGLSFVHPSHFETIRHELDPADAVAAERWIEIAHCSNRGDYDRYVELLINQNRAVMALRGGAPWIEVQNGKMKVKFREELGELPDAKQAENLWKHPYFLESLRAVIGVVRTH